MNSNEKALKSGFWYLFANFSIKTIALITTPIFTRLLTKEQIGDYSNFISWSSIVLIVITMSMESSLISAKFDYHNKLDQYNYSLLGLMLLSTSIWTAIINLFPGFFQNLFSLNLFYINLMLIYCFFSAVVNVYQISERYQYRYKRSVFIAVLIAGSTALISFLLVVTMQDRLAGRIIGTIIPYVIIGFVLLIYFVNHGRRIKFSTWPYILRICIPYIPHLLSLTILNSVDRIMITKICGSSDNALYSIAYTCGNIVTILLTSMNNAFSPWLGEKIHEESYNEIKKVSIYYIFLFCAIASLMMLLAPEILLILGGQNYLEARYVMTPVAMGCVCQFLYTLFVNIEQYKKKTIGMAFASVASALLNYELNAIFIPRYGYLAAAYTTLIGYLFLLIVHMCYVKYIGYQKVYSYSFIGAVVVVMLALTVGISFLYGNVKLRFSAVILFIMMLLFISYIKRNVFRKIFNTISEKKKAL